MKKFGSLLLVLAILFTATVPSFATIEEQEERLENLEQQKESKQRDIEATSTEISLTQSSIEEVIGEKNRLEEQIRQTDQDIVEKKEDIAKVQAELKEARAEVLAQQEDFGGRLRVMYLNKDSESFLSLLLKSRSIEDFLTKIDFMKSIADEDQRVLDELKEKQVAIEKLEVIEKENLADLEVLQESLEADKISLIAVEEALEARKAELETKRVQLEEEAAALLAESESVRNSIEDMKAEAIRIALEREAARIAAEQAARIAAEQEAARIAAEAAAAAAAAEAAANGEDPADVPVYTPDPVPDVPDVNRGDLVIPSSGFVWPTPGVYLITSPFGYRSDPFYGHTVFHNGTDIAGPTGSPIVAAASGIVVFSGWRGGYGNCVIISHPNGYETLYGHASGNTVSTGDIVNAGDLIQYMGSTGYSTGPHLHFEVITGGQNVDPMSVVAP